jgi:hypothetical protein
MDASAPRQDSGFPDGVGDGARQSTGIIGQRAHRVRLLWEEQ